MTVIEALKSLTIYPLGDNLLQVIAIQRGLGQSEEFTKEIAQSHSFIGAKADCYKELVLGLNVSQGGISLSISEKDKIIELANDLYDSIGESLIGDSSMSSVTLIDE